MHEAETQPIQADPPPTPKKKRDRKDYMRELMRKRRAKARAEREPPCE